MHGPVGLICARGGSKGLPRKNIKKFCGKPLIAWAIEQTLAVQKIDCVIVSTDSAEIADIAREYGAEVPFLRPSELALDTTAEWLVWRHALQFMSNKLNIRPRLLVVVPVTSPLRKPSDIDRCLDEYDRGGVEAVITIADSYRNPYYNMVSISSNDEVALVMSDNDRAISNRQEAPIVYDLATVAYVLEPEVIINKNHLFECRLRAVHIPRKRAVDIDTQIDFDFAEWLFKSDV